MPAVDEFQDLIERLDHVAMAVPTLTSGLELLEGMGAEYFCGANSVRGDFGWVNYTLNPGSKLELIAPNSPESFVQRFLDERGPGLHHITFKVGDVVRASRRAEDLGLKVFGLYQSSGWSEVFVHPRNALGTLIQFAAWPSDEPWTRNSLADVLEGRALDTDS